MQNLGDTFQPRTRLLQCFYMSEASLHSGKEPGPHQNRVPGTGHPVGKGVEEVPPECSGSLALGGEDTGTEDHWWEMMLPRSKRDPRGNNFANHLTKF